jgi:uncharacterized membrane protein YhaH (DUF805 family)
MVLALLQLLPWMLLSAITLVPVWMLFRRAGRSGWWALIVLVPLLGVFVCPWVLLGLSRKRQGAADLGEVFS